LKAAGEFRQTMKRKLSALSERYVAALREHLKQGPRASLDTARELGRQAVAMGLETLDMARIHERALDTLHTSASKDGLMGRADIFFTETTTPIEDTHPAALEAGARLTRLNKMLRQRTTDLAASNRSLKQGITQRKTAEAAFKKSGEHYKTLLRESLALQKQLRLLTHRILSAQEEKRKEIGQDLQNEIVQTLLGINVRLLTLKKEGAVNARGFGKELAGTQRMVHISAKTLKQFARACGKHHEPKADRAIASI